MPAIDPNRNRRAGVKVRRPKPKVKAPTKVQVRNARAQEQQYVSQGKAVKKAAKSQQTVSRAKNQEQQYVAQGKAVEKAAGEQRRTNRIKYLRRTRPTGMKLVDKLATDLIKGATIPSTGAGPNLGGRGNRPFTRVKAPRGAAAALAPTPVTLGKGKAGKVGLNFTKDLLTFPAQSISSTYDVAAGAVEAARGNPKRLKRIAKSIDEGDPVYNAGAAGVAAIKGDSKEAKKRLGRAGKAAVEHPGLTALEVVGVKGSVGRSAGRVGRSGLAGKAAQRAASTKRASRSVPGTGIVQRREYSRDVLTKAGQKAVEKHKQRRVVRINRKAASAPVERAQELQEKAARINPDRLPENEIKRRVDERIAANEDIRRAHRSRAAGDARKVVKKATREKHVLSLVAQNITKASKDDLKAYRDEITTHRPDLSNSQKAANKKLVREIDKVLADPKADMTRLESVAREYRDLTAPAEKTLAEQGLLAEGQVDRAKLIPYAVRNMGATHDKAKGIVDATGEPLTSEAIRVHMAKNAVEEPAFVTQAPNQRGAKNFNVRSERPVTASAGKRTGEATRRGTFDVHPETLVEGAAKAQGLADATHGFREIIKEFGHRKPGSKNLRTFPSYKRAKQVAADQVHDSNGDPIPGAVELQPVRIHPFAGGKDQLEKLLEHVDSLDQAQTKELVDALSDAVSGKEGPGPWALIPKAAADRVLEHLGSQGGGGGIKTVQLANQAFRKTVLSTSPGWFAGNLIEGVGRAALAKAGPRSYVTGRKVMRQLREIDPKAAEEAAYRMIGGGHFSSASRLHVRRGAEQFDGTAIAPIANALGKFWRAPGPKQAAGLWNAYTEFVFNTLNGRLESGIQTAMLGKELRKSELMDGHLVKVSQAAAADAARGLTTTENQVAFGRAVDRMYGKYSKFSPAQRKAFATYTPFAAWFLNSATFVYRTLPRDHPVATAVIAAAEQATEEWRKDQGLDLWMGKGALPGFLQGSIPTKGGGHFRAQRYLPVGAFSDLPGTLKGQVMPLWSSTSAALGGQDWKGAKLRIDGRDANDIEKLSYAALAFLEATVPVYSVGKRVAEQGPATLNPFKITKAAPAKTRKVKRPAAGFKFDAGSGEGFDFDQGSSSGFKFK